MPTIYIPTPMRKFTKRSQISVQPGRLASILSALDGEFPGIAGQLFDATGTLKRYINVFVNGQDIRKLGGTEIDVGDRDEVHIIPAMAGG